LVERAGRGDGDEQRKALEQLVRRYLPALRAHLLTRKRMQPANADDLLQEFLLSKLIERNLCGKADSERGRFRNLLLVSLNRFLLDKHRRSQSLARSVEVVVPIDENVDAAVKESGTPCAFDVAWAKQLLSDAIERMKERCQSDARPDVWGVFQGRLLDPLLNGAVPVSYQRLVSEFGLASPEQASNLLVTARRMFVRHLRELIAEYEPQDDRIDAEISDLLRILSGKRDEAATVGVVP
jgi:DNA-directed RNA polymerase specialized sigma24 family protein